jgi:hypothetical protein
VSAQLRRIQSDHKGIFSDTLYRLFSVQRSRVRRTDFKSITALPGIVRDSTRSVAEPGANVNVPKD